MPQVRTPPLYLPRPGYLEALGSAFVRFQFRHKVLRNSYQLSAVSCQLKFVPAVSNDRSGETCNFQARPESLRGRLRDLHRRHAGRTLRRGLVFLFLVLLFLPLLFRLLRRQYRVKSIPFLAGAEFYYAVRFHVFD